jgi:hypothetical protein
VTVTKGTRTACSAKQHYNLRHEFLSGLLDFEIDLFQTHSCMEREESKVKELSEGRFNAIIFLLRLAGIPLNMKKMSTIYAIYMISVIFSAYCTFLGMIPDIYLRSDYLGHAMTNIHLLIMMTNVAWIYFACR